MNSVFCYVTDFVFLLFCSKAYGKLHIFLCVYIYIDIYRTLSRMCNELYRNCHGTGPGLWKTVCCSALFRERPWMPFQSFQIILYKTQDHKGLLWNSQKLAFVPCFSSFTVSICNNNMELFWTHAFKCCFCHCILSELCIMLLFFSCTPKKLLLIRRDGYLQ